MMAATMFVSSLALAGSIGQSIDASLASRDASVVGIETSIDMTKSTFAVSQSTVASVNDLLKSGIKSSRQMSLNSIDSTIGSTDSKVLNFVAQGLRISVRVPTALAMGLVKGENFILTRASEGVFVLSREVGTGAIQLLEFHPIKATSTLLMAIIEAGKAAVNDVNELE